MQRAQLTKRAPDAGDSGAIPSIFLRLIIFPVGRRSAARPSAGNANRWAEALQTERLKMDLLTGLVMQVCDCTQCYENKPCDRVLKVTEQIRKMKFRPTKHAPDARKSGAKIVKSKTKRSVKSARG